MEKARLNTANKRPQTPSIVSLEMAKLPPQAMDFEQGVLGALMIDKRSIDKVINIFHDNSEVFYHDAHKEIYKAIVGLYNATQPIDMLTVANSLRSSGMLDVIGGDYYLVQLTQKVSSAAHIEFHARIVQQKYFQRELIRVSTDIINKSYDESVDVLELLDDAEAGIFQITSSNIKKSTEKADTLVHEAIKKIEEQSKKEGGISGLPSGFREIDKVTSGWQNSDLIIVAARPAMGKTAFVVSMAKNMAIRHNIPVALFSLEMSSVQLVTRMISSETGIPSNKLREGSLQEHEWKMLYSKVKNLEEAPLYIDETPALPLLEFRAKARRLVSQGVKMIIIDYLQLMTVGGSGAGNREQEISTISRNLKAIAKELNIPIVALSQLSRAVETQSGDKRPMLSHLRESGAIEQDADIVTFLYRPEYYKLEEWDTAPQGPTFGQAEFIIAKHRNGDLKNVRLSFVGELAQFSDIDYSEDRSDSSQGGRSYGIADNYTGKSAGAGFNINELPSHSVFESSINHIPSSSHDEDQEMPF